MAIKIIRILGVGTDITSVERMLKIINRGTQFEEWFLNKVLHSVEMSEYRTIG